MKKKKIILKLTGEIFLDTKTQKLRADVLQRIIAQLKMLEKSHQLSIVIGGGNFFRGSQHGSLFGMRATFSDHVGMLATIMNGLIIKDLIEQHGMRTTLFSALACPQVCTIISPDNVAHALEHDQVLIFAGGTGNPFFTTDTSAVLRALQINADEIWKATTVDGIYTADPRKNPEALLLKTVFYHEALEKKLGIMDTTAYTLAEHYKQKIRIFSIFEPDSLIKAAHDTQFGSLIQ